MNVRAVQHGYIVLHYILSIRTTIELKEQLQQILEEILWWNDTNSRTGWLHNPPTMCHNVLYTSE